MRPDGQVLPHCDRSDPPGIRRRHDRLLESSSLQFDEGYVLGSSPGATLSAGVGLTIGLQDLASEAFEPIKDLSLLDLSRKVAFLIAVACGRRCSEIHALSIDEEHLRWSKDGVSILPRAGFLAKNQTLSWTPRPVFLPDLALAMGRSEKPWCPVRALKWYLKRTEGLRKQTRQLFISTTPPHGPAAKDTVSRWVTSVIRNAHKKHHDRLTGSRVRAHDVRAHTSSWAFYKGSSIDDIINTVGWSSATTFQRVYLKDVLVSRRGGVATAALGAGRQRLATEL
jgi:integrase